MRPYDSLRTQADFSRVRRHGRRYEGSHLSLVAAPLRRGRRPQFGIVAGKPVGGAADRNRARRRIRAVLDAMTPPGYDLIVTARPSAKKVPFAELRAELAGLLRRLGGT